MIPWLWLISVAVGALAPVGAALLTIRSQSKKFEAELAFQRKKLEEELQNQRARLEAEYATEDSAESAIRQLLELDQRPYRSFPMIRHHIGGFEANELRKLLVRAGAVRFMAADGTELWALRDRVVKDYQMSRWKHPEAPQNKVPEEMLFPGVFNDPSQC
jgi:hypothetical protein